MDINEIETNPLHIKISLLLPWYVKQTLSEEEMDEVETHLQDCAVCREEVVFLQQWQSREDVVDDASVVDQGWAKLQQRLNESQPGEDSSLEAEENVHWLTSFRANPLPLYVGGLAASLVAFIVIIGTVFTDYFSTHEFRQTPAYKTLSSNHMPVDISPNVRIVFTKEAPMGDIQDLLHKEGLSIVHGPSEAGVYTLACNNNTCNPDTLPVLRQQPIVLFAELKD